MFLNFLATKSRSTYKRFRKGFIIIGLNKNGSINR